MSKLTHQFSGKTTDAVTCETPPHEIQEALEFASEFAARLKLGAYEQGHTRFPLVSNNVAIQYHYEKMRSAGQSHAMADMLAHRQAPGTKGTDQAFLEGTYNGRQFDDMPDWMAENILAEAKAAGVVTHGKVWKEALGSHTDPKAWVSSVDDVLAVCRERNLACSGSVKHHAHEEEPPEEIPLGEDIIREEMERLIAQNPDLARDLEGLREMVIERHRYRGAA